MFIVTFDSAAVNAPAVSLPAEPRPFADGLAGPAPLPDSAEFIRIGGIHAPGLYRRCPDFAATGIREWSQMFTRDRVRQLDRFVTRWRAEGLVEVVSPAEVARITRAFDEAYEAGRGIALDGEEHAEAPRHMTAEERRGWSLGYDEGLALLKARESDHLAEMREQAEWSDRCRMEAVCY